MLSGGSTVSWSVTSAATTVTVQVSPWEKSELGSSVKVVGPPETVAVCAPLALQEIEYHEPVTLTGSLNVIETLEPTSTPEAPLGGTVEATLGATSAAHDVVGEPVLRGVGAPAAKSEPLSSVSVQPAFLRSTAVVLLGAVVGALP